MNLPAAAAWLQVESGASQDMLTLTSTRPWGPKTRMKRLMHGTLGSPTIHPPISASDLPAKTQCVCALPFLSMLHATRRVALRVRERVCEANLCACALACCALRFMTETPPRHVQNYSAVALPYRPPRHANDIGSGYMHAAASPREAGGAGSMNAAAIGQLLGS